ncbi:coniferyl aldehyde dehydrogenase [Shewanella sedimentimangrovi]|uniref:Aldehyde dehydrogenase n=2 Tax=Shewanella sedimentimangrovi TaxID=2814293 RepID=A0ABX7QZG7_9GAMM|nr:coniferyl aldehyde dehydrogenase [Shewanella sedimentimangrovi]QSX36442.1 coniferyl aldehyde dehydrogenase [Shewanella sedimentimangrovi]
MPSAQPLPTSPQQTSPTPAATPAVAKIKAMELLFKAQRKAFDAAPYPDYEQRRQALLALKSALKQHQQQLVDALSLDYGHRSSHDSQIADILPTFNLLNYSLARLKGWMKPNRRHAGLLLAPAKVRVHYQPKGVIGIIVPWNFPIVLSLGPLVTALAAGNRVMLKLSEFTPATNKVLKALLGSAFDEEQVCVVEGEAAQAAAFSALPFDHLLFTGSTAVGRHVMKAAAANLTPVTLELGGKSPVLVAPDMDMTAAVERLIYGKCLNAGQICVAPDYVLLPRARVPEFVAAFQKKFAALYGKVADNADYSAIINERQWQRLLDLLDDAEAKGAEVVSASGEGPLDAQRKLATQLLLGVTDEMLVMQEEIFGPLLPLLPYDSLDEALDFIRARPRPLALYLMSFDTKVQQRVLEETHSGGVCINETVLHVAADDAPFGGIGTSGMGHYHGEEGFRSFSHARTVLKSGRLHTGKLVHPPYGKALQRLLLAWFQR